MHSSFEKCFSFFPYKSPNKALPFPLFSIETVNQRIKTKVKSMDSKKHPGPTGNPRTTHKHRQYIHNPYQNNFL